MRKHLPDKSAGIDILRKNKSLAPVTDNLQPASKLVADLPESGQPTVSDVEAVRAEVEQRFSNSSVGSMLSQYTNNRDNQVKTLTRLGKDVLLSLISQGAMPAYLSRELNVSFDLLEEYLQRTCSADELARAESRGAEYAVFTALHDMEETEDKDQFAHRRASFEARMRLAKNYNAKFNTEKQSGNVAVNINNTVNGKPVEAQPYLQIIMPGEDEELPPLKAFNHLTNSAEHNQQLIEDGIFTPIGETRE